ncbi:aldehyde dehydrogenase family protein [Paludisphaera borealis]|uniref:Succinate-semialdehyde dehydrogenase [NADP(+)] GabD n=1 Tax=Paludisphaera borealis TaxID=1387353 RepID=A0A1U7CLR5_9BACT|nr:aldehyde dehydrogenase family protein [Paludisphaera borealis]APW59880.1 Succinate-semialdehyde dehydrogenase [NADP(+)] GabD [Paludisphaera borealis]
MFDDLLKRLGVEPVNPGACHERWIDHPGTEEQESINPATGRPLARVKLAGRADYDEVVDHAVAAFANWRTTPAPRRGEVVRRIGQALREHKPDLGLLITLETGKIRSEGEGEVQEMIDMCDFAVGLSRQLYGLTIASERPRHRMIEQWHPLGPIGVITAFNFPAAVWAWNAMVAAVCGDTVVWKPSPLAPLTALAVQRIVGRTAEAEGFPGVFGLCIGSTEEVGERMLTDARLPLISATGSCRMGYHVAEVVGRRLGRTILELGGNNSVIVAPSADLDMAIRGVVFAAVGTAGQRCTTARRLIVHESLHEQVIERLAKAYRSLSIGDPWQGGVLVGPLIHEQAVEAMQSALRQAEAQGGTVVCGGKRLDRPGCFIEPALVRVLRGMPIVGEETFAPILYVITYREFEEAVAIQNEVEQGLTSAIFTRDLVEAERFLSAAGSDCGIANVNIGTSGAEIGGAFGGEKATGGGREAGSDSWKAYMRRQTCTINYGDQIPLAQGVRFDVESS